MNIHICLVSQQAAANLLPALDPTLKPAKIVLVVTAKMQRQAAHLTAVLKENAIQAELLQLSNEQDFHQTENELIELAARLEEHTVTLNITGGTKLMSVAAQSVAQASGWRMFYVDADTDRAIWLGQGKTSPHPLQEQLKLRHYLRSYGFELTSKPNRSQASAAQQRLTQTLVEQVGSLEASISVLNALAQDAENRRSLGVPMNDWQRDSRSLDVLLRYFEDAAALSVQGDRIQFASEATRDFVKGGWLELLWQPTAQWELGVRQEWLRQRNDVNGPGAYAVATEANLLPNEPARRTSAMAGWRPARDWLLAVEAGHERIAGQGNTVLGLRLVWTPAQALWQRNW